jgi:2Fe-2S ferredoxin
MKINATDRAGKLHVLEARDGWTVMEILRDSDMGVTGDCGGACACATCHVYVAQEWLAKIAPASAAEIDMLDMALAVEANSRLSCQIVCAPELDGIAVTVAPE